MLLMEQSSFLGVQNWPDLYLVIKLNKLNSFNCSSLVKPFPHLY